MTSTLERPHANASATPQMKPREVPDGQDQANGACDINQVTGPVLSGQETLHCEPGGHDWCRPRTRGRKPAACPEHPRAMETPSPIIAARGGLTVGQDRAKSVSDAHRRCGSVLLDPPDNPHAKQPPTPNGRTRGGHIVGRDRSKMESDTQIAVGPVLFDPVLAVLAISVDDLEAARMAADNRRRALTTELQLPAHDPAVVDLDIIGAGLASAEAAAVKALQRRMKKHPLGPYIASHPGYGEKTVARLLGCIGDPYWNDLHDRPRTVGELFAYAGLHVVNGRAPSHRRGERGNWNSEARVRCYVIAEGMIKNRASVHRGVYDAARERYADAVHPAPCVRCGPRGHPAEPGSALSDGHKHARAIRLVMREILRDLWTEARRLHGDTPDR